MADTFDAYHKWLGIPKEEQPPHHYRLLAIPTFEEDADVISYAADRQMSHLRTFQSGAHSAESQKLLNEVSSARKCLLTAGEKAAYDQQLRAKLKPPAPAPAAQPEVAKPAAPSAATPQQQQQPQLKPKPQKPVPQAPALPAFDIVTASPAAHAGSSKIGRGTPAKAAGKKTPAAEVAPAARKKQPPLILWCGGGVLAIVLLVAIGMVLSSGGSPEVGKESDSAAPAKAKPAGSKQTLTASESDPVPANGPPSTTATKTLVSSINLLKQVNLTRDALEGAWKVEGAELLAPAGQHVRLELPLELPAEYLLTLEATWVSGETNLCLGLPLGERQVMLKIDHASPVIHSGLQLVDGRHADQNETRRNDSFLRAGQLMTIHVAVRAGRIQAFSNGNVVLDWSGKFERLSMPDRWSTRDRRHAFVGGWNSSFRISKLEAGPLPANFQPQVRPIGESVVGSSPAKPPETAVSAGETDLLKQIDPARDAVAGEWKMEGGALLSPAMPFAKLQVPVQLPQEYELTLVMERIGGSDGFTLGLPIGGRPACVVLDGYNSKVSGLDKISGQAFKDNKTAYRQQVLPGREPRLIVYTVRANGVRVVSAGQEIFNWEGDPEQLSLATDFVWPDQTKLCLGDYQSVFRITRLSLRPLDTATKVVSLPPKTDRLFPTTTSEPTPMVTPTEGRLAPPDSVALPPALEQIKAEYADLKELYDAARKLEGKLPLAQRLMQLTAEKQTDPISYFALLNEARQVAAEAAESKLALEICHLQAARFEIDELALEAETLASCAKNLQTNSQRHDLAMECLAAMTAAIALDRYDAALELVGGAQAASAKSNDGELKKLIRAHQDHTKSLETAWGKVKDSAAQLATDPKHAAASLELGRFRCFYQADWPQGLKLLAQGSDPVLRSLAAAELKDPDKPEDQIRLGDDWWAIGEKIPMPARLVIQEHASLWYNLALATAAKGPSPTRTRIETRLTAYQTLRDKAGPLFARQAHPADAVLFGKHWYKLFEDRMTWEEAKGECEKLGGYLVCVESPEENLFLKSLAFGQDGNVRRRAPYWLGASDEDQEGVFRWVNGSQSVYADWKAGEPNNTGGNEHFVGILITTPPEFAPTPDRLLWNDYQGRERFCYICEWDR